jgi:hypothetical protein
MSLTFFDYCLNRLHLTANEVESFIDRLKRQLLVDVLTNLLLNTIKNLKG